MALTETSQAGRPSAAVGPELPEAAAALGFSRTVERELVHRRNLTEVFLTDVRSVQQRSFVAAALLPLVHAHYTSHTGPTGRWAPDAVLLLECCRQAETFAAHALFDVAMDAGFILRNWSVVLSTDTAVPQGPGPRELLMSAVVRDADGQTGGSIRSLAYEFGLWLSGVDIGQVRMEVGYVAPRTYAAIRTRRRGGPPPTSDEQPPVATGRPVDPARTGRINPTDTLLLDAVTGPDSVTAALRVPVENPSLFDHPQDHVPGMVLVEAARQIAALATDAWGGGAPCTTALIAVESSFSAYAELDRPVTMAATPPDGAGPSRASTDTADRRRVAVTFHQDGSVIARMSVVMAAVSHVTPPPGTEPKE
ncbi:AfsA-related hotdog domain-containing protein [Streptomyces sp. NPDC001027]|uniref:AfsA-related hotdog domain-containing protein n=1 Tax=Streptomyces sp. NPDC001027 TaxID=3154771 RepID=UPI0033246BE7